MTWQGLYVFLWAYIVQGYKPKYTHAHHACTHAHTTHTHSHTNTHIDKLNNIKPKNKDILICMTLRNIFITYLSGWHNFSYYLSIVDEVISNFSLVKIYNRNSVLMSEA